VTDERQKIKDTFLFIFPFSTDLHGKGRS